MDGAARAFAAPTTTTIGGREFRVNPKVADCYAEMEQHILSLRPDPFEVALASMERLAAYPEMQKELLRLASEKAFSSRIVTQSELRDWQHSIPGVTFMMWLTIRHNTPSVTYQWVMENVLGDINEAMFTLLESGMSEDEARAAAEDAKIAELHKAVDQASGADERGNSIGS